MSLDFIDEDRLLFTFHVSGLMERDAGDDLKGTQQQIQAKVVAVSTGKVESEAAWIVPDRLRYLWMLNDGHFLLLFALPRPPTLDPDGSQGAVHHGQLS